MIGKKKITNKHREVLKELANYTCERCEAVEGHIIDDEVVKLTIHKIVRGGDGGVYLPRNIKILCNNCHKRLHSKEF